ncbi:MAG: hypothetical protein ACRDIB_20355 [Ardenticatenaceae bacterium]
MPAEQKHRVQDGGEEAENRHAPEVRGDELDMTGEGWSLDEESIVGGESDLPDVEAVESSLESTTGSVEPMGRSITGAIGNVGSTRTTRGPDDVVPIEGETPGEE